MYALIIYPFKHFAAQKYDKYPISSRQGGTKYFQFEGIQFGWQAIIDMYHRECERRNNGLAQMIPRLREVHVLRDAWTKLNVHPAKIMQVCLSYTYTFDFANLHVDLALYHVDSVLQVMQIHLWRAEFVCIRIQKFT